MSHAECPGQILNPELFLVLIAGVTRECFYPLRYRDPLVTVLLLLLFILFILEGKGLPPEGDFALPRPHYILLWCIHECTLTAEVTGLRTVVLRPRPILASTRGAVIVCAVGQLVHTGAATSTGTARATCNQPSIFKLFFLPPPSPLFSREILRITSTVQSHIIYSESLSLFSLYPSLLLYRYIYRCIPISASLMSELTEWLLVKLKRIENISNKPLLHT